VIGGSYQVVGVPVDEVPYDLSREAEQVATFDIGILPEPDDAWTRGKGAFKALVYMATGLPVIASPVGVNGQVVVHGVTGFLAATPLEWVDALDRLSTDVELRASLGAAGRKRVEDLYSLNTLAPRFMEVLKQARGRD